MKVFKSPSMQAPVARLSLSLRTVTFRFALQILKGLSSNVRWVIKDKFKHMLFQKALVNEVENGTSTKVSSMNS